MEYAPTTSRQVKQPQIGSEYSPSDIAPEGARESVRPGSVLCVLGGEGAGKTYHLRALEREARERGFQVLSVRGHGAPVALLAIAQIAEQLGGTGTDSLSDATTAALWLRGRLAARARRQPLALLVDDIQELPSSDLAVLQSLVLAPPTEQLFVALTCAPGTSVEADALLGRLSEGAFEQSTLRLEPLTREELTTLVQRALGEAWPEAEFVERLREFTGGVPLYVVALLESLAKLGNEHRGQVLLGIRQLADFGLPPAIEDSVRRRLALVDEPSLPVMQALATVGIASIESLRELTGLSSERVIEFLVRLEVRGLVRSQLADGDAVTFGIVEPIVALAVLDSTPVIAAANFHERAAEILERSTKLGGNELVALAEHYLYGTLPLHERRAHVVLSAARQLNLANRYGEAHRLLRSALRTLPRVGTANAVAEAHELLAQALSHLGAVEEAESLLERYSGHHPSDLEPEVWTRVLWRKGRIQVALRHDLEAMATYGAILGAELALPSLMRERLLNDIANVCHSQGRIEEALKFSRMAADEGEASGDFEIAAYARRELAMVLAGIGRAADARVELRRGYRNALRARSPRARARVSASMGTARIDLGDLAGGGRLLLRGVRGSRLVGDLAAASVTARVLAMSYLEAGRWEDARRVSRTATDMDAQLHRDRSLQSSIPVAALIDAVRGIWTEPVELPLRGAKERADFTSIVPLGSALFERETAQGRPEAALRVVEEVEELLASSAGQTRVLYREVLPRKAWALAALGDAEALTALADNFESFATETGGTQPLIVAQATLIRGLAAAANGGWNDAVLLLDGAVSALERLGYRWRSALARRHLGNAHAQAGSKDAAAEELTGAFEVLSALGAVSPMELVRADLRRLNRRVRRTPDRLPGVTAREWDVMNLAAVGRTDAEIAQALWVSRRTVTTHMHNVLTKLGMRSRLELATWVNEHAADARATSSGARNN